MAITIDNAPRTFAPVPVSSPIEYELLTDEHIEQAGDFAFFEVTFNATGSSDGDEFTLLGETFSVDESVDYSATTFDYSGTVENAASNFVNMLRSNFLFADFEISKSSGGGTATASAFAKNPGAIENFTFDYSLLTTPVSSSVETNGVDTILRNYSIWFQVWADGKPVNAKPQFAKVPYDVLTPDLPCKIDIKDIVRGLVYSDLPLWTLNTPTRIGEFDALVYLRFGGVTTSDLGVNTFGQVYETETFDLVDSVFQLREINEFKNHAPGGISTIQWLTDRPESSGVPGDSYEWAKIWIEQPDPITADFRVDYVFDYSGGGSATLQQTISYLTKGVYEIPIGFAASHILPYVNSTLTKMTVTVYRENIEAAYVRYSEDLIRYYCPSCCSDQEIYFKEDKGSWGTLYFEEIEEAQLITQGVTIDLPLDRSSSANMYDRGGKTSLVRDSVYKCFLRSPKMPRDGELARYYAQAFRSPTHYVRTTKKGIVDGIQDRRRIVIDLENIRIFKRGETIRYILGYTFTTDLNLQ